MRRARTQRGRGRPLPLPGIVIQHKSGFSSHQRPSELQPAKYERTTHILVQSSYAYSLRPCSICCLVSFNINYRHITVHVSAYGDLNSAALLTCFVTFPFPFNLLIGSYAFTLCNWPRWEWSVNKRLCLQCIMEMICSLTNLYLTLVRNSRICPEQGSVCKNWENRDSILTFSIQYVIKFVVLH